MDIIGIEINDMDTGAIRVGGIKCLDNRVTVESGLTVYYNMPFYEISPPTLKRLFKDNKIKGKKVMAILPAGTHSAKLWTMECTEKESKKEMKAKIQAVISDCMNDDAIGNEIIVKSNIYAVENSTCYGTTALVEHSVLQGFYEVLDGFDVDYIIPQLTAYSLQRYENAGLMDIKETSLTLAVYQNMILVWAVDIPYAEMATGNENTAVDMVIDASVQAINAAKGNRLYPTEIYLTGVMAESDGIEELLSKHLEIVCQTSRHKKDNEYISAEWSTLIGAARGLYCENNKGGKL